MENMENIEKLKERVSKDPTSKLFVPLAEEYRKAGMHDEAIEVLKTGIEHQPGYMSARAALGKIYLEKDMKLEAEEEFAKVVKAIPDNLFAHRKLADIYKEMGQREKAAEQYRTVLALNPLDEEAQLHLKQLEGAGEAATPQETMTVEAAEGEEEALLEEAVSEEEAAQEVETIGGEEVEQVNVESTLEALSRAEERTGEEAPAEPQGIMEPEEETVLYPGEDEETEALEIEEPKEELEELVGEVVHEVEAESAGEEEMMEEKAPDFAQADSFIAEGDYLGAMSAYKGMLSAEPGNRHVLQRVEELKTLLKLLGKDNELLEANIEAFLEGIKKKRDEFFRGA
jgi:tetratricopeptide (TPR) repeat protein